MLATIWAWIMTNWVQVLVLVLAIDQALIPIFPQVAIFASFAETLKALISGRTPPPAA